MAIGITALVARPPSPLDALTPVFPFPATVTMRPVTASIRRTRPMVTPGRYRLPEPSNANWPMTPIEVAVQREPSPE